jgi:hypothetical protein
LLQSFVLKGQFFDRFGDVVTEDVDVLYERFVFGFEAIIAPFVVEFDKSFGPRFIRRLDNGWNEKDPIDCGACESCGAPSDRKDE